MRHQLYRSSAIFSLVWLFAVIPAVAKAEGNGEVISIEAAVESDGTNVPATRSGTEFENLPLRRNQSILNAPPAGASILVIANHCQ
jgi:hypothetical protein